MKTYSKKTVFLTVVVLLAAFFIYGGLTSTSDKEIRIGGAFGLSGQCAEFGEGELKSVQLAVDEVNNKGGIKGKQVKLIVEDTECEYKSTFNAINKLINVHDVALVIGPTWGDSFQSAVPLINKHKVPTISASAAMEALKLQEQPIDYYFSTWFSGDSEMQAIQDHMKKSGYDNVVVVHDQDPFGVLMSVIFKNVSAEKGIHLVNTYGSITSTEDYRVILSKVKNDNPDAVFMSFIGPDSKVKFLKQAREFGITTPMYSASDIQNESMLEDFGKFMEGVVYSFPKTAGKYEEYVNKYSEKYGSVPQGPSAANAYDAGVIGLQAIAQADSLSGPDIKIKLESIKLSGASSDILGFNQDHQMEKAESIVKTVKGGKFIEVK